VAYSTFSGRDGSGGTFSWTVQAIGGSNALVLVQDVGGNPVSASNPMPSSTPPDTALGALGATTANVTAASGSLASSNGSRKRIDISNSSTTAQVWIKPGGGTAAVNTGWLLPPQAQATYYTTLALSAISSSGTVAVGIVEW
jgi:hypothetical protein